MKRFYHEEQRERANQCWEDFEKGPVGANRYYPAPIPLPNPPFDWETYRASREELHHQEDHQTYSLEELGLGHLRKTRP